MVKLYSKNGCPQCKMTKRMLTERGIDFVEINTTEHPEYIEKLKNRGIKSLPVVDTETDSWTGFQPTKINALIK